MAESFEIDDSLYSRQRYMLGDQAMQRITKSSIFLSGLGGLGIEIAKNVVLAGVKSVTLHDTQAATWLDLGSNFFLQEADVLAHRNRAEACVNNVAELNPNVVIRKDDRVIDGNNLNFLLDYQCVVLTDAPLTLQCKVNAFCRCQEPPIQFISANVFGVFANLFCDFGPEFNVLDNLEEDPKEFFIGDISKSNPGVVTTLNDTRHGLEKGNYVLFKNIIGTTTLNNSVQIVDEVLSPFSFTICDTNGSQFQPYQYGGTGCQQKSPSTVLTFKSLEEQLIEPDFVFADLAKVHLPEVIHIGMQALHIFQEKFGRLPFVRETEDASEVEKIASTLNTELLTKNVNSQIIRSLSHVSRGCFAPVVASIGGIAGQEVLKALTGKFRPLKQWLYMDALEILNKQQDFDRPLFLPRSDRYDALRICVGEMVIKKIQDFNIFMIGCGAIGCELLKNFVLLGISCGAGLLTITDNDIIEKSNLNRQFLFRQKDIQKPKSSTAALSVKRINPTVNIDALLQKVSPETEESTFHDQFFEEQNLLVNAVDNVEARRYVDSRCVRNQRGLIETGTMGAKGHVQVIVPHITESYTSQRDPEDEEVPYCTLKSFPSSIEHTIQWARNKFESSFTEKVELFNKFWFDESVSSSNEIEELVHVNKIIKTRPTSWTECVSYGRNKFEKYFNHKAKQLMLAFPLDTKVKDDSLFWKSPRRPPTPQLFDITNDLHMLFVASASRLYANIHRIRYSQQDLSHKTLYEILQSVEVASFSPTTKKLTVVEREKESPLISKEQLKKQYASDLEKMTPLIFEKDDDTNGHIDFIAASANLRAGMYNIENMGRLKIKRIAGKIIPAIATTTSAIAGLASVEVVKVIMHSCFSDYRNCFMNLAIPFVIFAEPGSPKPTFIKEGLSFTVWDHWTVRGNKEFRLKDFNNWFKKSYDLDITMVVQGVRMVYVPIMPGHSKRLHQKMTKLLRLNPSQKCVDLTVSFAPMDGEEDDVPGPPLRYFID